MNTTRWVGTLLVGAVLALAGCSSSGHSSAPDVESQPSSAAFGFDASGDELESPSEYAASDGDYATQAVAEPRHVITEGEMYVTVEDPALAAQEAARLTADAGGRVDDRQEAAPTEHSGGSATLLLRIPSDQLEDVIAELKALGELESLQQTATDVTLAARDLDARIAALETSVDRLLAMLADAERTQDLISIEQTLQSRQGELESLKAERAVLAGRVALASLWLHLGTEPPPAVVIEPGSFTSGFVSGWESLLRTLRNASVLAGVLLPWLAFLGLVAVAVWAVVRTQVRRVRPAVAVASPGTIAPSGAVASAEAGAPVAPPVAPAPPDATPREG